MSVDSAHMAPSDASRHVRNSDALALELIDMLGVEGAKRMCREQCWDGVASAVERVSASVSEAA